MSLAWLVAKKEIAGLKTDKLTFFGMLFLGIGISLGVPVASDNAIFWLTVLIGSFSAYTLTGRAFGNEKYSGSLETLLCSPLSISEIWLGKLIGAVVPAYFICICTALALVFTRSVHAVAISLPGLNVLVFLVFVLPMMLSAFVGIFGSMQLFLDMKKNLAVTIGVMMVLVGITSRYTIVTDIGNFLSWPFLAACFFLPAAVLAGIYAYTLRASLEGAVASV